MDWTSYQDELLSPPSLYPAGAGVPGIHDILLREGSVVRRSCDVNCDLLLLL